MSGEDDSQASSIRTLGREEVGGPPPGNGLRLELAPFGLEHVYDYEHGGLHPVHLGDRLGENSRYVVVHKLGHGGFATVWLCRDTQQLSPRYVALKILMAETSAEDCPELLQSQLKFSKDIKGTANQTDRICLPLEKFDIEGPNGTHYCFVYPLLGPKVSYGLCRSLGDPDRVLRDISLKVVQGIASLHENGLCHGGTSSFHRPVGRRPFGELCNNSQRSCQILHPRTFCIGFQALMI